jgi:hypothetical protein
MNKLKIVKLYISKFIILSTKAISNYYNNNSAMAYQYYDCKANI